MFDIMLYLQEKKEEKFKQKIEKLVVHFTIACAVNIRETGVAPQTLRPQASSPTVVGMTP